MKEKNSFPIRVEKNGVTVPIYRVQSGNGYISYVISYRENGAPKRLGFRTVREARRAAKKAAKGIAAGNAKSVQLIAEDGHSFLRASAKLKPFGVHIETAAVDYAEALKILDGRSTCEAHSARSIEQQPIGRTTSSSRNCIVPPVATKAAIRHPATHRAGTRPGDLLRLR